MKKANKYIALLLTIAMLLTIVPRTGFCGGTRRAAGGDNIQGREYRKKKSCSNRAYGRERPVYKWYG